MIFWKKFGIDELSIPILQKKLGFHEKFGKIMTILWLII
jgi:hypothetical protein